VKIVVFDHVTRRLISNESMQIPRKKTFIAETRFFTFSASVGLLSYYANSVLHALCWGKNFQQISGGSRILFFKWGWL